MTSSWSIGDSGYAPGLSMMNAESIHCAMARGARCDVDAITKDAEGGEAATAGATASVQGTAPVI